MGILAIGAAVILAGRLVHLVRAGEPSQAAKLFTLASLAFWIGFAPYAVTFLVDMARSGDFVRLPDTHSAAAGDC